MNKLFNILFPPSHQSERDLLSEVLSKHFKGDPATTKRWMESNPKRVDWDSFLTSCEHKAKSVVSGLEAKNQIPVEVKSQILSMALREACARLLTQVLQSETLTSPHASPYTLGARYDQLTQDTLSKFALSEAIVVQFEVKLPPGLDEICVSDAQRAFRNTSAPSVAFNISRDKPRLPALLTVCELLACVPRELNYKLKTMEFVELSKFTLFCSDNGKECNVMGDVSSSLLVCFVFGFVATFGVEVECRGKESVIIPTSAQHSVMILARDGFRIKARNGKPVWILVCGS
jgi:hypothetical protein